MRKIQQLRGIEASLPILDVGQFAFTTDTLKTFVGSESENVQLANTEDVEILATQLADKAGDKELNILNVDYGEIDLPSDFPHKLPFKLFAVDENTIEHDFDINLYKEGAGAVYLDYTQASPTLDGLTPQSPKKQFKDALDVAESLPQETVIIYIMNKYYTRTSFALSVSYTLTKNIIFSPYNMEHTFLGNFETPNLLTWTSDENSYSASRSAVEKILDLSIPYKETEPIPYKKVGSIAEVKAEEGTWYTDGTKIWVRRFDDKAPDDDLMVIVRQAPPTFIINGKKLVFDRVSWFWSQNSVDALKVTGDINSEFVLYKSSVAHAQLNGLATSKVGKVFNIESKAYNNGTDGFNYHGTIPMVTNPYEFVYEFGTESFDNGTTGTDNNNSSTAHEGISILRVNTLTYRSEGPIVADVNGCYSILINCISHSSTRNVSSRLKCAFFFNNTSAVKPGKAILINCGGGGKDTYAVASDADFNIQVRRFKGANWWHETLSAVKFM